MHFSWPIFDKTTILGFAISTVVSVLENHQQQYGEVVRGSEQAEGRRMWLRWRQNNENSVVMVCCGRNCIERVARVMIHDFTEKNASSILIVFSIKRKLL